MSNAAAARAAYIDAREKTERAKRSFTIRARQSRAARLRYLTKPTRANRAAYRKAKATRAHRLRTYRRRRTERDTLKREYEQAKAYDTLPLRLRALAEARKLVGVMEQGGNNAGAGVAKIIRGGGGNPAQFPAWCGYFCAHVYRLAGSKAVSWQWAAVRLLYPLSGVKRTSSPLAGDLVRFTFDHVGMFVRDNGDGTITTVEGNSGASGAVSDGNGNDGVYIKNRSKTLVRDYLHITK